MEAVVTPQQLWAIASAPFCIGFAVSAAHRSAPRSQHALRDVFAFGVCFALFTTWAVASRADFGQELEAIILLSSLAYLAAFDLKALAIPVWPALVLIGIGLVLAAFDGALIERAAAALGAWAAFTLLAHFYARLRGIAGLGSGDALVAAAIGAWLGPEGVALAVAIGGAATLLCGIVRRFSVQTPLPFAPGLAAGSVCVLLAGPLLT